MTINNFFFTAIHIIWLYLLIGMIAKLLIDRVHLEKRSKDLILIKQFFLNQNHIENIEIAEADILTLLTDLDLMEYACECYFDNLSYYSAEEKDKYKTMIMYALDELINDRKEKKTALEFCMLFALKDAVGSMVRRRRGLEYISNCRLTDYWKRDREVTRI